MLDLSLTQSSLAHSHATTEYDVELRRLDPLDGLTTHSDFLLAARYWIAARARAPRMERDSREAWSYILNYRK